MSAESFTYTGSPWGYTAPGWTVFQRSPGITPKAAESLMPYFRYPGPPDGPVRFVYVGSAPSGQRVLAQSLDSGLRWYDKSRGHDYFAHVFVEPDAQELPAEFNPMSLYMSPGDAGFQTEFPAGLKGKALDILEGKRANEEPPPLPVVDSIAKLPVNRQFSHDRLFAPGRLSPGTVVKLASVAMMVADRISNPARHPLIAFDAANPNALDVMAAALALVPRSLRCRASFATFAVPGEIGRSSPLCSFTFVGVVGQGNDVDQDTGIVGGVSNAGFAFANSADAALFARIANAVEKTGGMEAFTAVRSLYIAAVSARMNAGAAEGNTKGSDMGNSISGGIDYSSIAQEDMAGVVDAFIKEGVPVRDIIVKAAEAVVKRSQGEVVRRLEEKHSRKEKELIRELQASSGGGFWKTSTMIVLGVIAGAFLGGIVSCRVFSNEREMKNLEFELSECKKSMKTLQNKYTKTATGLEEWLSTNANLRAENCELSKTNRFYKAELDKVRKKQETFAADNNKLMEAKAQVESENQRLRSALYESKGKDVSRTQKFTSSDVSSSNDMAKLKTDYDELLEDFYKLLTMYSAATNQLGKADKILGSQTGKAASSSSQTSSMGDKHPAGGNKDSLDKSPNGNVAQREKDVAKRERSADKRETELKDRDDKLKSEAERQKAQAAKLEADEEALRKREEEVKKRADGLQAKYDGLEKELKAKYERMENDLKAMYDEANRKLERDRRLLSN